VSEFWLKDDGSNEVLMNTDNPVTLQEGTCWTHEFGEHTVLGKTKVEFEWDGKELTAKIWNADPAIFNTSGYKLEIADTIPEIQKHAFKNGGREADQKWRDILIERFGEEEAKALEEEMRVAYELAKKDPSHRDTDLKEIKQPLYNSQAITPMNHAPMKFFSSELPAGKREEKAGIVRRIKSIVTGWRIW